MELLNWLREEMDEQGTYITHHVQQQVRERDRKLVESGKLGMDRRSQALTLTGKADMNPN